MSKARDLLHAVADALEAERLRMGFAWIGTGEADGREPGGLMLAWGRTAQNELWVTELPLGQWEPITDEAWRERYPHSIMPPRLEVPES